MQRLRLKADGRIVESNHPVAAFSGNVYSTYGAPLTGFNGAASWAT